MRAYQKHSYSSDLTDFFIRGGSRTKYFNTYYLNILPNKIYDMNFIGTVNDDGSEIFFETFEVPALYIAPEPLLSLFASGRGTGLVLDIGEGVTTYFPVYDGFAITPHIRRIDLGGHEVTKYLQLLLRKAGHIFTTTSELEVVRQIKESCSECLTSETAVSPAGAAVDYVLPDGNVLKLGSERWECCESLFRPQNIGQESFGVPRDLFDTVMACDLELRKDLFSNVLLSGGVTLTRSERGEDD